MLHHNFVHPFINCLLIDPVLMSHVVSENQFVQYLVVEVFVGFTVHQTMVLVGIFNAVLILADSLCIGSQRLSATILALFKVPRFLVAFNNLLFKLSFQAVAGSAWGYHRSWIVNRVFAVEGINHVLV
jgi:hypothetical protein